MSSLDDGPSNYASLARVLRGAYNQASAGKGKERHACDEPFQYQKICVINRWIADSPVAGALFQVIKKSAESARLPASAAIHELRGAINYLAAAIILLEEAIVDDEGPNCVGIGLKESMPETPQERLCSKCKDEYTPIDDMPCKKCKPWAFRPHFRPKAEHSI